MDNDNPKLILCVGCQRGQVSTCDQNTEVLKGQVIQSVKSEDNGTVIVINFVSGHTFKIHSGFAGDLAAFIKIPKGLG